MSEQVEQAGDGTSDDGAGRVALVTGAASGIGRATALRLAASGYRVGCFDLDPTGVEEVAATIAESGGEAVTFAGDVCDEETTRSVVAGTIEAFGKLDVLANVAGIGHFTHSDEETLTDWSRILGVNLTGTFLMCRNALPALIESHGAVVNVASIAGLTGHAYGVAYSASKGGVVSLTKTLAVEYATRDVKVNAVCPGGVLTPILNSFLPLDDAEPNLVERIAPLMGRFIEPDEIARAIEFLASPTMPNLTGAILVVDGATIT